MYWIVQESMQVLFFLFFKLFYVNKEVNECGDQCGTNLTFMFHLLTRLNDSSIKNTSSFIIFTLPLLYLLYLHVC